MKKELIFSLVGYVCFLIPALAMALWIYLFTSKEPFDFDDVKRDYLSYFPASLNPLTLTFICIALLVICITSLSIANSRPVSSGLKITNMVLTALAGALLFLELFSLM
jgi:hypothetical protein